MGANMRGSSMATIRAPFARRRTNIRLAPNSCRGVKARAGIEPCGRSSAGPWPCGPQVKSARLDVTWNLRTSAEVMLARTRAAVSAAGQASTGASTLESSAKRAISPSTSASRASTNARAAVAVWKVAVRYDQCAAMWLASSATQDNTAAKAQRRPISRVSGRTRPRLSLNALASDLPKMALNLSRYAATRGRIPAAAADMCESEVIHQYRPSLPILESRLRPLNDLPMRSSAVRVARRVARRGARRRARRRAVTIRAPVRETTGAPRFCGCARASTSRSGFAAIRVEYRTA